MHTTTIIVLWSVLTLGASLTWTWFAIWAERVERTDPEYKPLCIFSLIIPGILLATFPWVLACYQTEMTLFEKAISISTCAALALTTIFLSYVFSIKKYRADDLEPNYTTFIIISIFSIAVFAIATVFAC